MKNENQDDDVVDWMVGSDILSSLVNAIGLRGVVLSTMSLGAPWRIVHSQPPEPVLHLVTSGTAFFTTPTTKPITLMAGDVVMLPNGGEYEIVDAYPSCASQNISVPKQQGQVRCSVRVGGLGVRTELTCCAYIFRSPSVVPLLSLLPKLVVVRATERESGIGVLINELVAESKEGRPGTEGIISRLAEVIFIRMLRTQLESGSCLEPGVLAAIADKRVGEALKRIHASLATNWTVEKLARSVSMSRASFSKLFTEKTGVSSMQYIQSCRMQEAARQLRDTSFNLSEIAQRVGYLDATAFSRSFRRQMGVSPSQYRKYISTPAESSAVGG